MGGMNEAYDAGFATAARWAMRMELCSDMDSPAYMATRERAVSRLLSIYGDIDGIDREAYSEIATAGPGNA